MERAWMPGLEQEVSRVGLGTWAIGGTGWGGTEAQDAVRTIHTALDRGIDLVDTAPAYGLGAAEELVGAALSERQDRDRVVVATKGGLSWDARGAIRRDASPARLRAEVEDSLRRLRTDRIDLYQVHWPDPKVPFEETARTLETLRREGKLRAIGVSNFSPEQMEAFRSAAPLACNQVPYNLFERGIEENILPWCRTQGLGVLAYGPLCRGLLSGGVSRGRVFEGDDLRNDDPKFQGRRFDQYLAAVARLDALARRRNRRVLHLALRWVLDRPGVTVALWGARRPEQLDPLDAVDGWQLSGEEYAEIEGILSETIEAPVGPEFMAPPI